MRYFGLLLGCLFFASIASAQDSLAVRAFTMNGGSREFGQASLRISDNRSVLFNITSNCNTATCNHGMAGIMIDGNGKMIRYKKIGAITIDIDPDKLIYTSDGNILMIGSYGTPKWLVIKMDTLFNVIWTTSIQQKAGNNFSGPFIEDVVELNHCYYVTMSNMISKINESGTVVFSKYFGPSATNTSSSTYVNYNSITQLSASRFFIAGELRDTASVYGKGFACVADTNGNIVRQKKFAIGAPFGSGITHSFKVAANKIKVFGRYSNDIYTADVDTNLAVANLKKYSGTVMFTHSICYNGSDRFFLSAYESSIPKIGVFAVDTGGTVQWSKFLLNGSGFFRTSNHMVNSCTFGVYSSTPIGTSLAHKGFWAKLNGNGTSGSTSIEAPLTISTSASLPLMLYSTTVTDSGQWQTTFPSQTFISDGTIVADSTWYKILNPDTCTAPPPPPPSAVAEVGVVPPGSLCSPNPFYGKLNIGVNWDLQAISQLTVYDFTGKVVFAESAPTSRELDIPQGTTGILLVRWRYNGQYYYQKLERL